MHVQQISEIATLEKLQRQWASLAGTIPFRQWPWVRSWWDQFGHGRELCVLLVRDDQQTIGIAPWFVDKPVTGGRVLRFLGSGRRVCSEYLSLLCEGDRTAEVAEAVACWLLERNGAVWDYLRLSAVRSDDSAIDELTRQLVAGGAGTDARVLARCWRIPLPSSWDEYLAARPRRYRRKLRRLHETYFDSGRAVVERLNSANDLPMHYQELADLHQLRHRSLGQAGSFTSPQFHAFLRQAAEGFYARGELYMGRLLIGGEPAAAALGIVSGGVLYMYQCGMAPSLAAHRPGWLMNIATIRHAIEQGLDRVDFLRGDEPYKCQLGGEPTELLETCLVGPRLSSRLYYDASAATRTVKSWIRAALAPR